jgi:transcriptional regulator with XRE-family HTH domain
MTPGGSFSMNSVIEQLVRVRVYRKLTQQNVADHMGTSRSAVSRFENDATSNVPEEWQGLPDYLLDELEGLT